MSEKRQKPHLLSPPGMLALKALINRRPLLAFDFDGTLAPIVAYPDQACLPTKRAQLLQNLANLLPVAIVTGRQVADCLPRLGFTPLTVIGSHGAENPADPTSALRYVRALNPVRENIRHWQARLDAASVFIEDKMHSIAFHYRQADCPDAAQSVIAQLITSCVIPLSIFGGKYVMNVMAADAPDKADAVHALAANLCAEFVFYAGDDVNDEPVFVAARSDWVTVKIGTQTSLPSTSAAGFYLESTDEVDQVLMAMLAFLKK